MAHHRPRKRFGQHFLLDDTVVARIVEAVGPRPRDRMVEIGPGLGALTRPLLRRLDHLHVVEIDRDLAARLKLSLPAERITVHQADALDFDFSRLGPELRVVGNLPYNISSPLLFHLAAGVPAIRDIHVMLQKEVVARMVAAPGGADYGRLSVMLQYRFEMQLILTVPSTAFRPPPKVESAVVRMVPSQRYAGECRNETLFAALVAKAFMQRRKTLRNSLRTYLKDEDYAAARVDAEARAQQLSVGDYLRLANRVASR